MVHQPRKLLAGAPILFHTFGAHMLDLGTRVLMSGKPVTLLTALIAIEYFLTARTAEMTIRHTATITAARGGALLDDIFLNELDIRIIVPKCTPHQS
jgi:hypothetical protein